VTCTGAAGSISVLAQTTKIAKATPDRARSKPNPCRPVAARGRHVFGGMDRGRSTGARAAEFSNTRTLTAFFKNLAKEDQLGGVQHLREFLDRNTKRIPPHRPSVPRTEDAAGPT